MTRSCVLIFLNFEGEYIQINQKHPVIFNNQQIEGKIYNSSFDTIAYIKTKHFFLKQLGYQKLSYYN